MAVIRVGSVAGNPYSAPMQTILTITVPFFALAAPLGERAAWRPPSSSPPRSPS